MVKIWGVNTRVSHEPPSNSPQASELVGIGTTEVEDKTPEGFLAGQLMGFGALTLSLPGSLMTDKSGPTDKYP